jgi:uncharacterized protein YjbI with pentapeptide repeats
LRSDVGADVGFPEQSCLQNAVLLTAVRFGDGEAENRFKSFAFSRHITLQDITLQGITLQIITLQRINLQHITLQRINLQRITLQCIKLKHITLGTTH